MSVKHYAAGIIARGRLTTKNRLTVPGEMRKTLNLKPGDVAIFEESAPGTIRIRKAEPLDPEVVSALEGTQSEWYADADDRAYQDL
ncbi:MAG TPA: AbrB/MazE/SpoVT family DNA-binding domain-containing protein [Candidatus Binataceae bacterium]|nr:AbrB/MazE/SpoVT family DNA-binding domain-containing protein [Candidatus Binataceae bacterium]